jgi:LysR family hydrogen peroxide-inducible transcriptional activator
MNLRDLEYLVALEEEKHFRKAAERCFVSQPTLSGQLRKLEDELGVILIERTSRKVLFTPAGDAMARQARKVLKEARELKSIGQHFAEPMSGEIHIGFIPTVGPYLLPHIIQDLREHFPSWSSTSTKIRPRCCSSGWRRGAGLPRAGGAGDGGVWRHPPLSGAHVAGRASASPGGERQGGALHNLKGKKLLMLADGHCLRDQAMGFCLPQASVRISASRAPVWRPCATWSPLAAA